MAVFYQQSGKRGEADFLKTLTHKDGTLRQFTLNELEQRHGFDTSVAQRSLSPDAPFQIWGVPSGARKIVTGLQPGDLFLLIGQLSKNALEFGRFFYAGEVLFFSQKEDFELSARLWGDGGFPLIFFMSDNTVDYSWIDFTRDFEMSPGYYLAGQTQRLKEDRLRSSRYGDAHGLKDALGLKSASMNPPTFSDGLAEGAVSLVEHRRIERSRELVEAFKATLEDFSCVICGFDFERHYGEIGRKFVEAHHIAPLGTTGPVFSRPEDLIPVCANCHRMLHRRWPALTPSDLRKRIQKIEAGPKSA